MHRLASALTSALLLATAAFHAGCGNGASGLTTGAVSTDGPAGGVSNEHPMARPVSVAWTSARAKRCGFYFDPAKLRSSYLAYETQHGAAPDQVGKIQSTYDSTYDTIAKRIGADADYCSDRKTANIKGDLQKVLVGDYTPNLPQPKADNSCGFFGCTPSASSANQPLDAKDFWKKQDEAKRR
jgi:hypothetical protein